MFELLKTDSHSKARLGRLRTPRGTIETPVFMPVGTQASVKALDPRELLEMGTPIICPFGPAWKSSAQRADCTSS